MTLSNWIQKYKNNSSDECLSSDCIEEFKEIACGRKNIFYGAKILGEAMYNLFKELEINVYAFVDKNYEKIEKIHTESVYEPEWLLSQDLNNCNILTTVDPYNRDSVLEYIGSMKIDTSQIEDGHLVHSILQNAWCTSKLNRNMNLDLRDCMNCSIMKLTCNTLKSYLVKLTDFDVKNAFGTDTQKTIGYTLSGVCTLKCKDCHEMTPYSIPSKKKHVPKDIYLRDMKKVLDSCKFITTLELVGGEPFAYPYLYDILKETIDYKNLGFIHIFSNGTILPNDDICKLLNHPRIAVTLTNFAEKLDIKFNKIFEQVKNKLNDFNVQYVVRFLTTWQDANSFDFRNDDEETLRERFSKCRFSSCRRLTHGVMYVCMHDYAGELTGLLPLKDNQIRIHDYDKYQLSKELEDFNTKEYFNICNYCPLPDRTIAIPAAVQL